MCVGASDCLSVGMQCRCVSMQSVRGSVCQCVGLLVSQFGGASVSRFGGMSVCRRSVGGSVCLSVCRSVGQSVSQSVSRSVGLSVCRSVSLSVSQFGGASVCRSVGVFGRRVGKSGQLVWECHCVSTRSVGESACSLSEGQSFSMMACRPVSLGERRRRSVEASVCGRSEGRSVGLSVCRSVISVGGSVCGLSVSRYAVHPRIGMRPIGTSVC